MLTFADLIAGFKDFLHLFAELAVYSLELIGIFIIIIGSFKALVSIVLRPKNKKPANIVITLGRTLAFALEFKLGAEIINTVIVRDLKELAILAIVIVIRALLALLIHWEIKMESNEEDAQD